MSELEVEIPEDSTNIRTYSLPREIKSELDIDARFLDQIRYEIGNFSNYKFVICTFCGHSFLVLYN